MSITVHCLIKNEENFIWYSLQSVLPYVDKVLVWDTGSTDRTAEIVKLIDSPKIEFAQKGVVDEARHTELRNEMISRTTTQWFMILDGDEIWPRNQLKNVLKSLATIRKNCLIPKFIFCAGDIYHHSTWGSYKVTTGSKGHYTARFFRNIDSICWRGEYDHDSLYYSNNQPVVTPQNCEVSPNYFFHAGVLPRSSKDLEVTLGHGRKVVDTYALGVLGHGKKLPQKIEIPEVFFLETPSEVKRICRLSLKKSWFNLFSSYLPNRL